MHTKKHGASLTPYVYYLKIWTLLILTFTHCGFRLGHSRFLSNEIVFSMTMGRGYYPKTDKVQIVERDICVISPFVRTLLPLRRSNSISKFRSSEFHYLYHVTSFHIPNFLRRLENPKYFVYHRCWGSCIIFRHGFQHINPLPNEVLDISIYYDTNFRSFYILY